VTELINCLRNLGNKGRSILNSLPLERLRELSQEMLSQYHSERSPGAYSSYFKALVCLNIAKRLVELKETRPEDLTRLRVRGSLNLFRLFSFFFFLEHIIGNREH
jgi:hypothetical protein